MRNELPQKLKKPLKLSVQKALNFTLLSHEDSNLDIQNQNLLYYPYTMGQRIAKVSLSNRISKTEMRIFK